MKKHLILTAVLIGFAASMTGAMAQDPQGSQADTKVSDPGQVPGDSLNRGTPRGSIIGFLEACEAADFDRAAQYLDLRNLPDDVAQLGGPELARELNQVLSRSVWFDDFSVSDQPEGARGDDLPEYRDPLVSIPTQDQQMQALWMQHVPREDGVMIWKVSNRSVALIPELYRQYSYPPYVESIRKWFPQGVTFFGLELFKWFIALAVGLLSWPLLHLLGVLLSRVVSSPSRPLYPLIRKVLTRPLVAVGVLLLSNAAILKLGMSARAQSVFETGTVRILVIVWVIWSLINLVRAHFQNRLVEQGRPGAAKLTRPLTTFFKLLVLLLGVLFWLSNLGVNITTLLAGLGVGGLAVALALQKPIEDLMGALSIFSQAPIRVGDLCRYGSVLGTVEDIGLRTTRFRTLANTVVSVPNSRLANDQIENLTKREKIRYCPTLRLRYDTRVDQIRGIRDALLGFLRSHPRVLDEPMRVRFTDFEEDALLLKVHCYMDTGNFAESLEIREELNLRLMELVEEAGARFALPGRALYVEGGAPSALI